MFEEAQLYAPVTRSGDDVTVHLAADHPGAVDPEYRARRNALAALAMDWRYFPAATATLNQTTLANAATRPNCRQARAVHKSRLDDIIASKARAFASCHLARPNTPVAVSGRRPEDWPLLARPSATTDASTLCHCDDLSRCASLRKQGAGCTM